MKPEGKLTGNLIPCCNLINAYFEARELPPALATMQLLAAYRGNQAPKAT